MKFWKKISKSEGKKKIHEERRETEGNVTFTNTLRARGIAEEKKIE